MSLVIDLCDKKINNTLIIENIPDDISLEDGLMYMYTVQLEMLANLYNTTKSDFDWLKAHYPKKYQVINVFWDKLNEIWKLVLEDKSTVEKFKSALMKWNDAVDEGMKTCYVYFNSKQTENKEQQLALW